MRARQVWARVGALTLVSAGVIGGAEPAAAATITVTTTADELNADGDCSLREAVQAANTDAAADACSPGAGADVITLGAGTFSPSVTLVLSDPAGVELSGAGVAATTITGSDDHRILDVSDGPLTVRALSLVDGDAGLVEQGGAIRTGDDAVMIDAAAVTGHHAAHGGAIATDSGAVVVTDSVVSDNLAMWNDLNGNGGAINSGSGSVTIARSTFSGNTAANAGGAVLASDGTVTVTDSTFDHNTGEAGGAIYGSFQPITVVNSTFDANTVETDSPGYGGAIEGSGAGSSHIVLHHVTLTGTLIGHGVVNGASVTITSSILADNADGSCSSFSGITSGGGNVGDDDTCGLAEPDDVLGDPLLGALGDNGGATLTRLPLAGSPAIDAALADECEATDQRGANRPADGDDDGVAGCDSGAVEVAAAVAGPPTVPPAPPAQPVGGLPDFTG